MAGPEPERRYEIVTTPAEAGERLDRLLAARLPDLSRSRIKALIEAGHASAGGRTIKEPSQRVKPGQTFAILIPEARPAEPRGQAIPLDILYEDEALIVVNKPAGMVVHPAPGNEEATLVNALIAHCGSSLSGIGGVQRPGIVHRLDKDTSGLMVAAKTDAAHRALSAAFARREVERAYQAVVWGVPARPEGRIEGAIGRHPVDRKRMALVRRGGKPALTTYKVLKSLNSVATLVECRLATGRTHQIRVHMAAIGHPVVGDPVYGRATAARLKALGAAARGAVEGLKRQALHATVLGFRHPATGERLRWQVGLPSDIENLIAALRESRLR
ncbi:MAG: RluA family pseudouridine synthase [Rhodospirillaceae bacterium]|nr:RluA family pseudouridine synthase [Rhodospirillaceae bacterium]